MLFQFRLVLWDNQKRTKTCTKLKKTDSLVVYLVILSVCGLHSISGRWMNIHLENQWQRRTEMNWTEQECHNSSSTTNSTQTALRMTTTLHVGSQQQTTCSVAWVRTNCGKTEKTGDLSSTDPHIITTIDAILCYAKQWLTGWLNNSSGLANSLQPFYALAMR